MSKLSLYLMGFIAGSVIGISWGLGHATQWAYPGPHAGMFIGGMVIVVTFGFASYHETTP